MVKMFFQGNAGWRCVWERMGVTAKASLLSRRDFSRFHTKAPALAPEFLGINFNHKSAFKCVLHLIKY